MSEPAKESLPRYTIGVVATETNLNAQTLRYYEKLGLVEPARTRGKVRLYSDQDLDRLRLIQRLMDLGINLAGVEVVLHMRRQLIELRSQLAGMAALEVHAAELEARIAQLEGRSQYPPPYDGSDAQAGYD